MPFTRLCGHSVRRYRSGVALAGSAIARLSFYATHSFEFWRHRAMGELRACTQRKRAYTNSAFSVPRVDFATDECLWRHFDFGALEEYISCELEDNQGKTKEKSSIDLFWHSQQQCSRAQHIFCSSQGPLYEARYSMSTRALLLTSLRGIRHVVKRLSE